MSILPEQPTVPASRPTDRQVPPRASRAWLWVILFTYIAIFIRFASISLTPLWGDEAAVYWRTCGTYEQLLQILQNDGFAPLHYEFAWALKHLFILSPGVIRFLPALAAVLMVPAMYFLARQLVSQKTALVVAAFTAVSAHLGWHAHDAKMYSHMWLFCALSMGSLLWWMRGRSGVAWWCWVASSVAAVGLHSLAWGVIAIEPVVFLAHRPRWRMVLAYLAGMAIVGAGPAVYYTQFNRWTSNIQEYGWTSSGIAWIEQINGSQTAGQLTTAGYENYLFGGDYPSPLLASIARPSTLHAVGGIVPMLLLVGLFPWAMLAYRRRRRKLRKAGESPDMAERAEARLPQPWWRSALIVAAWALLIPYAFYCASFADYRWPHELVGDLWDLIRQSLAASIFAAVVLLLAMYCCGLTWRERIIRILQLAAVTAVLLLLGTAIAYALRYRPPGPLWTSRYIGIIWPAIAIGTIALLMRIPGRPIRWIIIVVLLALNLGMCIDRARWRQSAPIDLVAADVLAAAQPDSARHLSFLFDSPRSQLIYTTEGKYYLCMEGNFEITPAEFQGGAFAAVPWIPSVSSEQQTIEQVRGRAKTRRLVIWDQVPAPMTHEPLGPELLDEPAGDDVASQLPGKWQRTSATRYPYYNRWGWGLNGIWRRREYVRQDSPTTGPRSEAKASSATQ